MLLLGLWRCDLTTRKKEHAPVIARVLDRLVAITVVNSANKRDVYGYVYDECLAS
jgi:hypothetical protein